MPRQKQVRAASQMSYPNLDPLVVFRQQRQRLVRHQEEQPVQLLLHTHPLLNSCKLKHTHTHTGYLTQVYNSNTAALDLISVQQKSNAVL